MTRIDDSLVYNDFFSVAAAGAILQIYLSESEDIVTAIGYVNSHTPALRQAYQPRAIVGAARRIRRDATTIDGDA